MSWVEWQGEVWPATDRGAELEVHLWPPGAGCARVGWSLSLDQYDLSGTNPETGNLARMLNFEIGDLNFRENDWRRFSNREIKADAAWHAAQEHSGEYGYLDTGEMDLRCVDLRLPPGQRAESDDPSWVGHAFIVRFGARDGHAFPCEIDAWLIEKKKYYRTTPELPEELIFPQEPPNLRVITRAVFRGGSICTPRCGDDPLPTARRFLREEIGCTEMHDPKITWSSRKMPGAKEYSPMPGWTSTVRFKTRPAGPLAATAG